MELAENLELFDTEFMYGQLSHIEIDPVDFLEQVTGYSGTAGWRFLGYGMWLDLARELIEPEYPTPPVRLTARTAPLGVSVYEDISVSERAVHKGRVVF